MSQDPLFLVSIYLFVAVLLRFLKPNLLTALFLAAVMFPCSMYLAARHGDEVMLVIYKARDQILTATGHPPTWPPESNRTYPDLALMDESGRLRRLSEFRGKVILLQLVNMSCPACVAFSGGHARGAFQDTMPQADLDSVEEYVERYGGVQLDDPRVIWVQVILFNRDMQAPTAREIAEWAKHFGLGRLPNQVVLGGPAELATDIGAALVPGFQLLDQDFILRMDSAGYQPRHDLYRELLPLLGRLVRQ